MRTNLISRRVCFSAIFIILLSYSPSLDRTIEAYSANGDFKAIAQRGFPAERKYTIALSRKTGSEYKQFNEGKLPIYPLFLYVADDGKSAVAVKDYLGLDYEKFLNIYSSSTGLTLTIPFEGLFSFQTRLSKTCNIYKRIFSECGYCDGPISFWQCNLVAFTSDGKKFLVLARDGNLTCVELASGSVNYLCPMDSETRNLLIDSARKATLSTSPVQRLAGVYAVYNLRDYDFYPQLKEMSVKDTYQTILTQDGEMIYLIRMEAAKVLQEFDKEMIDQKNRGLK